MAHDDAAEQICGFRKVGRVVIGNNVFVGAGTTILPGVTIGDNSIIGAGSIVNKPIPENCVAVGVPARVVKSLDEYISSVKEDIEKADGEGRILDITYDTNCKTKDVLSAEKLAENTNYYFKITRFCDEEN